MACQLIDFNESIMAVNQLKDFAKMCIPIFECFFMGGGVLFQAKLKWVLSQIKMMLDSASFQ